MKTVQLQDSNSDNNGGSSISYGGLQVSSSGSLLPPQSLRDAMKQQKQESGQKEKSKKKEESKGTYAGLQISSTGAFIRPTKKKDEDVQLKVEESRDSTPSASRDNGGQFYGLEITSSGALKPPKHLMKEETAQQKERQTSYGNFEISETGALKPQAKSPTIKKEPEVETVIVTQKVIPKSYEKSRVGIEDDRSKAAIKRDQEKDRYTFGGFGISSSGALMPPSRIPTKVANNTSSKTIDFPNSGSLKAPTKEKEEKEPVKKTEKKDTKAPTKTVEFPKSGSFRPPLSSKEPVKATATDSGPSTKSSYGGFEISSSGALKPPAHVVKQKEEKTDKDAVNSGASESDSDSSGGDHDGGLTVSSSGSFKPPKKKEQMPKKETSTMEVSKKQVPGPGEFDSYSSGDVQYGDLTITSSGSFKPPKKKEEMSKKATSTVEVSKQVLETKIIVEKDLPKDVVTESTEVQEQVKSSTPVRSMFAMFEKDKPDGDMLKKQPQQPWSYQTKPSEDYVYKKSKLEHSKDTGKGKSKEQPVDSKVRTDKSKPENSKQAPSQKKPVEQKAETRSQYTPPKSFVSTSPSQNDVTESKRHSSEIHSATVQDDAGGQYVQFPGRGSIKNLSKLWKSIEKDGSERKPEEDTVPSGRPRTNSETEVLKSAPKREDPSGVSTYSLALSKSKSTENIYSDSDAFTLPQESNTSKQTTYTSIVSFPSPSYSKGVPQRSKSAERVDSSVDTTQEVNDLPQAGSIFSKMTTYLERTADEESTQESSSSIISPRRSQATATLSPRPPTEGASPKTKVCQDYCCCEFWILGTFYVYSYLQLLGLCLLCLSLTSFLFLNFIFPGCADFQDNIVNKSDWWFSNYILLCVGESVSKC